MVAYSLLEEYCKITTLLSVVEYVSTAIAAVGKCVLMNAYEKCLLNRVDEGDTVLDLIPSSPSGVGFRL